MKRPMVILIIAMTLTNSYLNAQTTFGITGGVNWQTINGKDQNGEKYDNSLTTHWHAGVNAEIPVATDFYFQPGLIYNNKGAKYNFDDTTSSRVNLSYVELPLNLLYKPQLGGGRLILGFGPYVGFGVGGDVIFKEGNQKTEMDVAFKNDVKITDPQDEAYFKRIDAGANVLAGYAFNNKFSVQLNAQLGLTNIFPNYEALPNDKQRGKNTGFGVSLGYRFK